MKQSKFGFTLIEILVVSTIIVLLTATAVITYSAFVKQSRDARRKTDLEQLRTALEMYRSNNDTYPPGSGSLSDLTVPLTTGGTIYVQKLPSDPKTPIVAYYYFSNSASNYSLCAFLEAGTDNCMVSCAGTAVVNCNYCLGPYGLTCP